MNPFRFIPLFFLVSTLQAELPEPAKYVDPMIGTDGSGHVFPGATTPFGMVQVSPDTGVEGWGRCSGYHYADKTLLGFSHTHLSGTGCGDLGNILFFPTTGEIPWEPKPCPGPVSPELPVDRYRVGFSHSNEHAEAGYYRVQLDGTDILVELTATDRSAVHRYTFPQAGDGVVLIDLNHKVSAPKNASYSGGLKLEGPQTISGWQHSDGWASDKTFYFVAEFSQPIESSEFRVEDEVAPGRSVTGKKVRGALHFKVNPSQPLVVKVGISATGVKGAWKNLKTEVGSKEFNDVRSEAVEKWNAVLGKIAVDSSSDSLKRTFYTALYHSMVTPNLYNDVDGSYVGPDHKTYENPRFDYYSTFSLWDTFRASHPLYTLIAPERASDFIKSLMAYSKENSSGRFPVWALCSNDTSTMIGYHAVPVIVDAYFKGLRDFNAKDALEAMKISANSREGHEQYVRDGFAPSGFRDAQGVSRTLEYAFDDWCISQFAEALGATQDAQTYAKRAENFRNVYDPSVGFMRGKDKDGKWIAKFDPAAINFDCYTEANAWQYYWSVMHDIPALIELTGGPKAFTDKLDKMWASEGVKGGLQDVTGIIGQYAHGNEPCHHVAYLYNYAGQPWKTQKWVRKVMDFLYTDKLDGLCGNDDCGQMSAWYVLSAIGIYPVNPANGVYIIGSPVFSKAVVTLGKKGEEKTFTVEANNNTPTNVYIQSATLNGEPLNRGWLTYKELAAGGTLRLEMSSNPNKEWGAETLPPKTGY